MLTLYIRPGCPYCERVLSEGKKLNLSFEVKDIYAPGVHEELMAKGGKRQMPFLVDTERNVSMYESEDIVAYLKEHYGTNT